MVREANSSLALGAAGLSNASSVGHKAIGTSTDDLTIPSSNTPRGSVLDRVSASLATQVAFKPENHQPAAAASALYAQQSSLPPSRNSIASDIAPTLATTTRPPLHEQSRSEILPRTTPATAPADVHSVEHYQRRMSSYSDSNKEGTDRILRNVQYQLDTNRQAAANFINTVLGTQQIDLVTLASSANPDADMLHHLADGVVINNILVKLFPNSGAKPVKKSLSPWVHKENVTAFLNICEKVGVGAESRFESSDLVDGKNMKQVYITLNALERLVNVNAGTNSTMHSTPSVSLSRIATVRQQQFSATSMSGQPQNSTGTPYDSNSDISPATVNTSASSPGTLKQELPVAATLEKSPSVLTFSTSTASLAPLPPALKSSDSSNTIIEDAVSGITANMQHLGLLPKGGNNNNVVGSRSSRNSITTAMLNVSNPGSVNSSALGSSAPLTRRATRRNKDIITLGRYQLANCIGKGQFGSVYQAFDTETGNVVAIKRIALTKKNKDAVDELMSEVQLLKSLSHPNIVKYLGLTKEEEYLDIVLEYMECGSLLSLMKKYDICIQEPLASAYVRDILNGLNYLHSRGVVHCDLKCANILTTKDSLVKITDFGVSRQLNYQTGAGNSGTGRTETSGENASESIAGTPYWMAPEVIRLEGACTASDIWSLGCTIIEMITGHPPYSDMKNPMAVLFRIVEDDEPPIPDRDTISDELHSFLSLCFRQDIAQRATAEQLLQHNWITGK